MKMINKYIEYNDKEIPQKFKILTNVILWMQFWVDNVYRWKVKINFIS